LQYTLAKSLMLSQPIFLNELKSKQQLVTPRDRIIKKGKY
jgi:hypothetical protein